LRLAAAGALCRDSQVDCSLPDDDEDDADYDQNPADDDNDESDKEDDGGGECILLVGIWVGKKRELCVPDGALVLQRPNVPRPLP